MSQSRLESLAEAATNVAIGFSLAFGMQLLVFAAVGIEATTSQSLGVAAAFTVLSIIRSYVLRRLFERATQSRESP